jgi:hypothetical protein
VHGGLGRKNHPPEVGLLGDVGKSKPEKICSVASWKDLAGIFLSGIGAYRNFCAYATAAPGSVGT